MVKWIINRYINNKHFYFLLLIILINNLICNMRLLLSMSSGKQVNLLSDVMRQEAKTLDSLSLCSFILIFLVVWVIINIPIDLNLECIGECWFAWFNLNQYMESWLSICFVDYHPYYLHIFELALGSPFFHCWMALIEFEMVMD